ncbi:MAG: hypothetical protein IPF81_12200 [Bacteroidetes bacterium]|nr:hypothetical protein [Bacteroidota bacterium]
MRQLIRTVLSGVFFLYLLSCSTTKLVPLTDIELKAKLKSHITTLASDTYEGREAGSKGEGKASDYIVKQFKSIGLKAKGTDGFSKAVLRMEIHRMENSESGPTCARSLTLPSPVEPQQLFLLIPIQHKRIQRLIGK